MLYKQGDGAEGADHAESTEATPAESTPAKETTADAAAETTGKKGADDKKTTTPREPREPRERKQRGPPEDGVASKTKVMVANLPYDLKEDKVCTVNHNESHHQY